MLYGKISQKDSWIHSHIEPGKIAYKLSISKVYMRDILSQESIRDQLGSINQVQNKQLLVEFQLLYKMRSQFYLYFIIKFGLNFKTDRISDIQSKISHLKLRLYWLPFSLIITFPFQTNEITKKPATFLLPNISHGVITRHTSSQTLRQLFRANGVFGDLFVDNSFWLSLSI
ncbi:Hypothetical_protein [Hexamita inflata]|uniref:Hypothetical_protein n=1 Tax=Hexamita inflata TaxID=28002 RepID=A0AA86NS21_9EUKA|nr:Hypothetical protein HINF_LOCUS12568 [Hexamita inflata]